MNKILLFHLIKEDLIHRYTGSVLGCAWIFLSPIISILIYLLVFSEIMGARLSGSEGAFSYGIYLVVALLPWQAFSSTVIRSSSALRERSAILKKMHVDMIVFSLVIAFGELVYLIFSFLFFVLLLGLLGEVSSFSVWALLLLMLFQQVLAAMVGYLFSLISVFVSDVKDFLAISFQLIFWLTPIVYVSTIIPESYQWIIELNPFSYLFEAYRAVFINQTNPSFFFWLKLLLILISVGYLTKRLTAKVDPLVRDCL